MNNFSKPLFRVLIATAVTVIAGCSSIPGMDQVLPDRKVEYKKSKEAKKNLEVPPDLTASSINDDLAIPTASAAGSATLSSLEQTGQQTSRISGRSEVLPEMENIEFMRDGAIKKTIDLNEAICKGCGVCMATCPKEGVYTKGYTYQQIMAMGKSAIERTGEAPPLSLIHI